MQKSKLTSIVLWIGLFLAVAAPGAAFAAQMDEVEARGWIKRSDLVIRGETQQTLVLLDVKTPDWTRQYEMRFWMRGTDETFARVTAPARVKGQGYLKIKDRLWQYLPSAERTVLIPPSLMLEDFMGSDFSNDDFVKMSYLVRDYTHKYLKSESVSGHPCHVFELLPKPDAAVVYGKLVNWVREKDAAPVRIEFYDDAMKHIRTLDYSDFKMFSDREYPTVWRMTDHVDAGHESVITVREASFNQPVDPEIFTSKNLENPR